ncbi:MAG: NAD(+) synthase [Planctomycetota bacterium]|nr:MAG: NAD(+) synthase [Planctomycetota bacterium]
MRLLKLSAAALNQTPLDWNGNRERILAAVAAARAENASILCLPELCVSGYGCEDAFFSAGLHAMALDVLDEIVPATRGMIVAIGVPIAHDGVLYNTACLAADGRILGFAAKQHLAGEGIHYEPRWFKPWPAGRKVNLRLGDQTYPLGDLLFDVGGVKIGFEICEDAWVAARPGRRLAQRGVDIILNPSASHFAFGKTRQREQFVLEGARAFSTSYVFANLLGNEAGRAIYDGSVLIASADKLLAVGPRFSYRDVVLTTATIDVDLTRMHRARTASYEVDGDAESDSRRVAIDFEFPPQSPQAAASENATWERGPNVKCEEFARAVPLALFDYLRKSRAGGFVVSLSGGADSSAVACLVAMMVEFAVAELGRDTFAAKLAHIAPLAKCQTPRAFVRALLACVYQSTRNSSATTENAARAVAEAVGAEFISWSVDALVEAYKSTVATAIGRELSWSTDDLALQNIQARTRAPGVWLLANLRGALLLATSNRSEAAVGYTTMDGDTCGGLSPIAGIDKAFLRQWLAWVETTGPADLRPIPELAAVTQQAPTAELRPAAEHQTDEADLMPYDLLDAIERAAIRDKQTPLEVFEHMRVKFPQYDREQLAAWVERFFRLWCRNQWKRERYAPCFHLDDENLDPKTWCRFPILSGGYERELADLRRAATRG